MKLAPLMAVVLIGGCTLIDQNTFNPHAKDSPVIPPAPKPAVARVVPAGAPPLLTFSPGAKPSEYAGALSKAVRDAQARKPDVMFDVVEMEAPDAPADVVLGAGATEIARALVADGVPPTRIRLAARPDAGAIAKEVRVYVH